MTLAMASEGALSLPPAGVVMTRPSRSTCQRAPLGLSIHSTSVVLYHRKVCPSDVTPRVNTNRSLASSGDSSSDVPTLAFVAIDVIHLATPPFNFPYPLVIILN